MDIVIVKKYILK